MIIDRAKLNLLFSDGKLPNGDDFATLIESLAHSSELESLRVDFSNWKTHGEIRLGTENGIWRLYVDAADHARFERIEGNPTTSHAPDVHIDGWVSMPGRVGALCDDAAFADANRDLDVSQLQSIPGDGQWHTILKMPKRSCAFELTAATAQAVHVKAPNAKSFLSWLTGFKGAPNSVLHVVASANGDNAKPQFAYTANPDAAAPVAMLAKMLLLALLVALGYGSATETSLASMVAELRKWFETSSHWVGVPAGLIALLSVLRPLLRGWRLKRDGVSAKWVRAGGSLLKGDRQWELKLRGPAFEPGTGDANIYYHITRLWS